ncbi:MAG: hypothetical protein RLZZ312_1904 [Bacteroidota bacterium]|jgi:protein TonB
MKLDIFKGNWIDMVFDGKNKAYGAYNLRKENPKTTTKALIAGALLFSFLMALPMIDFSGLGKKEDEKVVMVDMKKLAPPPEEVKPKIPPPPPPPPAPKIDQVKFVKPKVVEKEKVVEEIKTIEELKDKDISNKDIKGRDDGKILIDEPAGDGDKDAKVVEVEDNKVYNAVEVKPDFPGGIQKFFAYFMKNFKTPEGEEISGKIQMTFVVEKDGSVTDIKIIRDLGYGTGKEAKRVLENSPKWKPGIQNGRPVRVQYNLPISIVLGE